MLFIEPDLLHFEVVLGVSQGEHPESAVLPVVPRVDDVGQQQGEAAVVVQPPHVNAAVLLLHRELVQVVEHLLGQVTAADTPENCHVFFCYSFSLVFVPVVWLVFSLLGLLLVILVGHDHNVGGYARVLWRCWGSHVRGN
jgi:hypothetical protein